MKLQDKVAVVTGAASGMGKQIAIDYAREGAKVVVSDLNLDGANETVEEIKANGGMAFAIKTNVAVEEDIQHLIDTTVSTYGTVDILVNNAGIMDGMEPAGDIEDSRWDRIFAINTTSVMRSTRKVLPIFLEKQKGVIINIASAGGLYGARAGAAYTASKHAVVGFTKNTGFMYANEGIRCNAIAPGGVETNIGSSMTNIMSLASLANNWVWLSIHAMENLRKSLKWLCSLLQTIQVLLMVQSSPQMLVGVHIKHVN